MLPSDDELDEIVTTIWSALLGLEVCPAADDAAAPREECITGAVDIDGGWEGKVLLEGPLALARKATAIMMGKAEGGVSGDDLRDAWGELANVTGGNLKAILSQAARLSLPTVQTSSIRTSLESDAREELGEPVQQRWFTAPDGHVFCVTLRRRATGA
jgi:chemotaxis protein CheX